MFQWTGSGCINYERRFLTFSDWRVTIGITTDRQTANTSIYSELWYFSYNKILIAKIVLHLQETTYGLQLYTKLVITEYKKSMLKTVYIFLTKIIFH